jgi:hypothetical protein
MSYCLALDNYLIPYKFDKNEHFQAWLDAQLSRFTFANSQEEEAIHQDIYDRRFVGLITTAQNCLILPYSNKREPKNKDVQSVGDVWEHIISGSLDGHHTITRCSKETLQFVPQEQSVKANKSLLSLLSCRKLS